VHEETPEGQKDHTVSARKRWESEPYAEIGVSAIKAELMKVGATLPSDRSLKREGLVKKTS